MKKLLVVSVFVNYTQRVCLSNPSIVQMNVTDFWLGSGYASVYQFLRPNGYLDKKQLVQLVQNQGAQVIVFLINDRLK
jgi:hypothetical protein